MVKPYAASSGWASAELGIDERTCRRRRARDGIPQDRRPAAPQPVPRNTLSEKERQAVLDTATARRSKACRQPDRARLADQGRYIASEARFYRILWAEEQQHPRGRAKPPHVAHI